MTSPPEAEAEAEDISDEELAETEADISEAELAETEADISEEELAEAAVEAGSGSDPELAAQPPAPSPAPAPAPSPSPAPPAPAPAPAPPAPGAKGFLAFVQRQPALSFVLVFCVVLSPFLYTTFQKEARRQRVATALNAWEVDLASAGLPTPFVQEQDVPPPAAVAQLSSDTIATSGFGERYAQLTSWSAMLAGRAPGEGLGEQGFGAALSACDVYRQASEQGNPAPLLRRGRTLTNVSPELLRPTLSLVGDLLAGQHRQVIHRTQGILEAGDVHPACVAPLQALNVEATRRRVRAVLAQRPAPLEDLRELVDYAGASGADVAGLLDAEAGDLHAVLGTGSDEVPRVRALLELLVATHPDGFAPGSGLAKSWPGLSAATGAALERALARWEDDARPVAEVLAIAHHLDPKLEVIPTSTFASWRGHLQQVVDDPARLQAFASRFLELGYSPAGVEELLATHSKGKRPLAARAEDSPGALMVDSIMLAHAGDVDTVRARQARLDALLAGREDHAAARLRARFAHLRGWAAVEVGAWDEATEQLARAEELGFEPRFRLQRTRSRCALGRGDVGAAVELARAEVAGLEEHALKAQDAEGDAVVRWELVGYPVHPNLLDPIRAQAHLDLAALLVDSDPAQALAICEQIKRLDRRNPRLQLVQGRALLAEGQRTKARTVVFQGIRALQGQPGQETLRRRLQELLKELGPN